MKYPATITDNFTVSFRDIPSIQTCGNDLQDALDMAHDALIEAIESLIAKHKLVPLPSKPKKGEHLIELPASLFTKILLINELIKQNVRQAELARLLNIQPSKVTRIVNPRHATKINTLQDAFHALGKNLVITVS